MRPSFEWEGRICQKGGPDLGDRRSHSAGEPTQDTRGSPLIRVPLKNGRSEERPINGTMDRFLSPAGCHQNGADRDQSDAGCIPYAQPFAKKDHRKDCHQHHTQFVERSDLSGIAQAERAEIA
jgi:hypothetical protein